MDQLAKEIGDRVCIRGVINDLQENGYCCVRGLLTAEVTAELTMLFWDWFATSFPDAPSKEQYAASMSKDKPPTLHGIFRTSGIAHSYPAWAVRTDPTLWAFWLCLWKHLRPDLDLSGPDALITSFDVFNISTPPKRKVKHWDHKDQGKALLDFEMYQGIIQLDRYSSTSIWPRTHLAHREHIAAFPPKNNDNWVKITKAEKAWLRERGYERLKVTYGPGDLFLFDSRLFHEGGAAVEDISLKFYTACVPRCYASPKTLEKRWKCYNENRATSHWPHRVKIFPVNPRTWGNDEILAMWPVQPPTLLTKLIRYLIGYFLTE